MQYLVLGHFEKGLHDKKGFDTMMWLTLYELNMAAIETKEVDEALDEWERASAAARKEALHAVRCVAAE